MAPVDYRKSLIAKRDRLIIAMKGEGKAQRRRRAENPAARRGHLRRSHDATTEWRRVARRLHTLGLLDDWTVLRE